MRSWQFMEIDILLSDYCQQEWQILTVYEPLLGYFIVRR